MHKLNRLSSFHGRSGPLLLIIIDGIGLGEENDGNAVFLAKPKTLIRLTKECQKKNLYCTLKSHGIAVGLVSDDDMGNSEVGHNTLGAGKIYDQGAKLVDISIKNGSLFRSEIWMKLINKVKDAGSTVHLLGLLSDGNVHSNLTQIVRIIENLAEVGVIKVRIHVLTDGRDVPARSALNYIDFLELRLKEIMFNFSIRDYDYKIASGGGRMVVTMDRYESDWNIVRRGWYAHVLGRIDEEELKNGYRGYYQSAREAINHAQECFPEKNDQYLPPFVITDKNNKPVGKIVDNDLVINFNFRGDRAIQISKAFEDENFDKFDRIVFPKIEYAGLVQYDEDEHIPKQYLVPHPDIRNILSDYCCANNITSFAIAETHKYGHVTYFWNGNRSGYICLDKEKYMKIESEPNEMIAIRPQMMIKEVCNKTIETLQSGEYKFVRVNLANGDMVGHTGNIGSSVKAVQVVDNCVKQMIETVNKLNGITIVTADHGNCEEMKFPDGKIKTSHSLNPVGFWIVDKKCKNNYQINLDVDEPGLSNVAATILNLLGFEKPEGYRDSLIKFN